MIQRLVFTLLCCLLLLFTPACNNDQDREDARRAVDRMQQVDREEGALNRDDANKTRYGYDARETNDRREDRFNDQGQNKIGYFRYNPEYYKGRGNLTTEPGIRIDRPTLAKHIASLVTVLPNVKESTVLVTDDHIFVGITPKKSKDPKTIKEAKRTAESVTPRYFRVHVTDSKQLQSSINELGLQMQRTGDVEGTRNSLNQLLKQMGDDTPPG